MPATTVLETAGLSKDFSGVRALDHLDLAVQRGAIHSLMGPNGSGKTTFFNVVTGILPASEGRIFLEGRDLTAEKAHVRTELGIGRTFQIPRVAPEMTCLENAMLGLHCRTKADVFGTLLRRPFSRSRQEGQIRDRAVELLRLVGLEKAVHRPAKDLAWVEEQLLQLARAMASQPKLLLLDEPTAGMGPAESAEVKRVIAQIREQGTTIILVAHDLNLVNDISDLVTVINFGQKIAEGTVREIQRDPAVMEAYLGRE